MYVVLPIYKIIFEIYTDLLFQNFIDKNVINYCILRRYVHCTCIYMNKCIGLEVCSGVTSIAKDHNNCYKIEAILLCN